MNLHYIFILLISLAITFVFLRFLIPRLKNAGLVGNDINKPDKPEVAEMGGIAIVAGFTAGMLLAVFLQTFFGFSFDLVHLLAALITVHAVGFIGIVDDLLDIPQWVKAALPLFAAVPLVAVEAAGSTSIMIPFVGLIDFGILYTLILIPVGIAVASNLTNMFGGFNGMESGLGIIIFLAMSIIAFLHGSSEMLILFLSILGSLLGFFYYNKYPARVFPGDVGNLTIGAVLAAGVIIGDIESAGALLLLLYVFDFFIKLKNKFPSKFWWGEYREGKLYPYEGKVKGLAQLVMKKMNGISEQNLVLFFFTAQIVISLVVIALFGKF